MALPAYVNASTGTTDAGGAWSHTSAAPAAAGNIYIVQVLQDGTGANTISIDSVTNAENLAGTDNVLTSIGEFNIGSAATGSQHLWIGRSLNTSAMVITGGNTGTDDLYIRVYEFSGVSTGTTLATVIENVTAGTATGAAGTSTSVADVGVTTLGPDRLALNFVGLTDDSMGLAAFTGMTGGTWALPVAIYETATGTDATIALNTANMASAGTINGGTDTITSVGWGVVGFALKPTGMPLLTQSAYRFYEDGTEAGSSAITAQGGVVVDSYAFSNVGNDTNFGASNKKVGQSFTGDGSTLLGAVFQLKNTLSATGSVQAAVYAHTGTFGTNGTGTGAVLATSAVIDVATIPSTYTQVAFSFVGANQITLTNATKYVVVLERDDANNIVVGSDITSPGHSGNFVYYDTSWNSDGAADTPFSVLTSGDITRDVSSGDSNLQLRVRLQETDGTDGGVSTDDYQLQYELNDSGSWSAPGTSNPVTVDSYSESNDGGLRLILASDSNQGIGQSFEATGAVLEKTTFHIIRVGSPTGSAVSKIYAHSGTFGTSSVPTGTALATSDNVDVSTISTSVSLIDFTFSSTNKIFLPSGTNYVVTVEYSGGLLASDYIAVGQDLSSPTHSGNRSTNSGSWASSSGVDVPFYVYGNAPLLNYNSASLTDGNATTNRLGSGTGSFVAGEISEDGLVDNLQITASNYTELLYSLTIDADAVADNDTLDFRVLRNGATTGMTYTVTPRITIEKGGGTPSPSVSDSITLSESTSLLIPELFINKSESITVTESTTRLLESYISKSESVTITENTDPELVSLINVSENTTISESIEKVLESYINKSDNITLTENTSTLIPELLRSVSDSVTLTENTKVELNSDITKSESVTLTENVATDLPITINKSESVMITENPVADLGITVNKSEDITIIENAVASIVTDTPADYDVNVNDTVTITEALQRLLESYVNKSESVTLTESVTVLITELFLSVSDSATVTENLQRLLESYISKSESLTITEALSLLLESSISVSDSATITENTNRLLESYINKSESVTVTESVNNLLENLISVSDNATLTENLKLLQESYINKSENVTLTESVVVYEPTYNLSVSDDITITDSPSVAIQLEGAINTNDTATVSESINLLIPELYLSTNDTATISESTNLELTSRVNVTDTATLTENTRQELNSFINVSDEVTLTENAVVEVQEATTLQIAVSDTTTITESTSFFTNPLLLSKSENITITENRDVSIEGVVNLRKYFIDLDGNVYYVLNQTAGIIEKV